MTASCPSAAGLASQKAWLRAFGAAIVAGVSGCTSATLPLAALGPVAIEQGGINYVADLQLGASGTVLSITRDGMAFANSDGLAAKRVADQFCAGRGARVNRQAFGHFAGGAWLFEGGCA